MICYKCITRQQCDERQNEIGKLIISLIEKNWGSHYKNNNQPERSKREDSHKCSCTACKFNLKHADLCPLVNFTMQESCEMRCSEHCGNTVRGK